MVSPAQVCVAISPIRWVGASADILYRAFRRAAKCEKELIFVVAAYWFLYAIFLLFLYLLWYYGIVDT